MNLKKIRILAIETSCDETAMAVLEIKKNKKIKFSVLSNIVSSQAHLHSKYGGVYPFLAKREHLRNLPIVFKKIIKESKIDLKKIDLIAVTAGPGLEPCLWTGINFAKEINKKIKIPIIPINHIEAHILVGLTSLKSKKNKKFLDFQVSKIFPTICLVVSGGHTQIVLMEKIGKYKIIGQTKDDAAGECFDKAARVLNLGYPGGPLIAKQSSLWQTKIKKSKIKDNYELPLIAFAQLPRPMINQKNYDFSFSGLKTAIINNFKNQPNKIKKSQNYIQKMSFEVEQAIIDVLIKKTIKAAKDYKAKAIILAGGVSANIELRRQLKEKIEKNLNKVKYLNPEINLCTDNALMIAISGYFNLKNKKNKEKKWKKIKANANLKL